MDMKINNNHKRFQLTKEDKGFLINKKRVLIGSSETCDVVLKHTGIAAIHAVIESKKGITKIYDMNSINGTYVNGKKVIFEEIYLDDVISFGKTKFTFSEYDQEIIPPVLDMLSPKNIKEDLSVDMNLPDSPDDVSRININLEELRQVPKISYPLGQDPKADYLEYIFEDTENLYPIFKYGIEKYSVEVIILYKDKIFSVDYLPRRETIYNLVGYGAKRRDIEYAYLRRDQKEEFIDIKSNDVFINLLDGYEYFLMSDDGVNKSLNSGSSYLLNSDDILRLSHGEIQIFVRLDDAPPSVKAAPIITRDGGLKRSILIMMFLVILIMLGLQSFEVDKDLDKEKIPERIATILYQKKLYVSKKRAIDKTVKTPKMIQKTIKISKPLHKNQKQVDAKPIKKDIKKNIVKTSGVKVKKTTSQVKKANPNMDKRDNKKNIVKKNTGKKSKKRKSNKATAKKSTDRSSYKGSVDTYKSLDFSNTVSSLLSKGGATKKINAITARQSDSGLTTIDVGDSSSTLKRAKVKHEIGSLSGVVKGRIDSSKGLEGLAVKRSIYTVGIPANTVILGSMDPDVVRQILMANFSHFRNCYQRELSRSTKRLDGVLPLNFIIGASGHVTNAGIKHSKTRLPKMVKNCVLRVLKSIVFPEPRGGGVIEVNQPMNFYRK